MKKILYYLPRVLSILFIVFISLFALDVFGEPQWFLALIIHLIPTYILIALTLLSNKTPKLGGGLFILVGALFLVASRFESLIISIPAILIGLLYYYQYSKHI